MKQTGSNYEYLNIQPGCLQYDLKNMLNLLLYNYKTKKKYIDTNMKSLL